MENNKPKCKLIGENGNIFNLLGIAARTLQTKGYSDRAEEMSTKVFASKSYYEALAVIGDYVEIV